MAVNTKFRTLHRMNEIVRKTTIFLRNKKLLTEDYTAMSIMLSKRHTC